MDAFIRTYEGHWDEDFCDDTIEAFERNRKQGAGVVRNDDSRKDYQLELHQPSAYYEVDMKESNLSQRFFGGLVECVSDYITELNLKDIFTDVYFKNMLVQRNDADTFESYSRWHCEVHSAEVGDRLLTYVMYLDDEAENNGTEFRYQKHVEKAKKGKLVLFPAGFTHVHRGSMITSGKKTIITGWVYLTNSKTQFPEL